MVFISDMRCLNDRPVSCVRLGLVRGDADEVRVASESIFGYRHVLGDTAEKIVQQLCILHVPLDFHMVFQWVRQRRSGLLAEQAVGVCRHGGICQRCR